MNSRYNVRGQVLPMLALAMVVLILFTGLAIDFGYAFMTKAALSKAVDAAALAGMKNLSSGQTTAQTIAVNAFAANYGSSVTPSIGFATSNGNTVINVSATAAVNTFFIRLLPGWNQLNVAASAQATRANLIMSLVLDRSGSMVNDGGSAALPSAVDTFINYFDDNNDHVAMVSFATSSTVDVTLRTGFKSPITTAVSGLSFGGRTFSQAGMLNAQTQNNSLTVPAGENVAKVIVFFTDGWANMIQNQLTCNTTPLNFGGCSAGDGCSQVYFFLSTPPNASVSCSSSTFPDAQTGLMTTINSTNVSNDAMYRAVQVANAVRAETIPTTVYAIGLGNSINKSFLQQMANDPSSSTFDSTKPAGSALFVQSCPGSTCTADLNQAFQTIASQILLRLSR